MGEAIFQRVFSPIVKDIFMRILGTFMNLMGPLKDGLIKISKWIQTAVFGMMDGKAPGMATTLQEMLVDAAGVLGMKAVNLLVSKLPAWAKKQSAHWEDEEVEQAQQQLNMI